jgi:thioredoxin-like negative regulator of GroEL
MKFLVPLAIVSIGFLCYSILSNESCRVDSSGIELGGAVSGFDSESNPGLVLMKFGAPWCPPCRLIDGELRQLRQTDLPVEIRMINVDDRPELVSQFDVGSIPRLILMEDGRKIGDLVGYRSAEALAEWIQESASSQALASKAPASEPTIVHANPYVE